MPPPHRLSLRLGAAGLRPALRALRARAGGLGRAPLWRLGGLLTIPRRPLRLVTVGFRNSETPEAEPSHPPAAASKPVTGLSIQVLVEVKRDAGARRLGLQLAQHCLGFDGDEYFNAADLAARTGIPVALLEKVAAKALRDLDRGRGLAPDLCGQLHALRPLGWELLRLSRVAAVLVWTPPQEGQPARLPPRPRKPLKAVASSAKAVSSPAQPPPWQPKSDEAVGVFLPFNARR